MKSCWAKKHSKCKGIISREHVISAGIFEQKTIFVQGFDWCKNEKEVGISNITSKILCEKHNNGLSEVDQFGIDAVRIIESVLPENVQSISTSNRKDYIDGYNFERWLLKTAINLSANGNNHLGVGMADSEVGLPPPYLLAVLFGEINFTNNMGLYFLYPEGRIKIRAGTILAYPIIKNSVIAAFVFHIRGLDFLLSLFPGHSPQSLRALGLKNPTLDFDYILDSKPEYRSSSLVIKDAKGINHQISFKW